MGNVSEENVSDDNNQKSAPETKLFYNQLEQDDALLRNILDSEEAEIEIEPSEVTEILPKCAENENQIELLSEAYHLVYGGPRSSLDSSPLKEIKTPMGNTVLHIAAWYGNNDVVDLVVEHAPDLLFLSNENEDTALHVAARGGNVPTVKKLLAACANFQRHEIAEAWARYNSDSELAEGYDDMMNMEDLIGLVKKQNVQGNTMLHEALICGKSIGAMIFQAFEPYNTKDRLGESLSESCYEYALESVNQAKQSVLYLAVEGGDKDAVKLILDKCPENVKRPNGLSPVVAAIMKHDEDMLINIILRKKPNWIHLMDKHGRLPLHYAASTGYHKGVVDLLGICKCCSIRKDKYGCFPIHLASYGGHVEVVEELLGYCPDPTEMLDNSRRNILHIAAKSGKHEVVRYILQTAKLEKMINQKDNKGDTPLHLATRSSHPKTVYYLTWDDRVDLGLVNQKNETALDIVTALYQLDNSSMRQQLTWTALKSAGAKPSSSRILHVKSKPSDSKPNEKSPKMELSNDKSIVFHIGIKPSDSKPNEESSKMELSGDKSIVFHIESKPSDSKPNEESSKMELSNDKSIVFHIESKPSDSKPNEKSPKMELSNDKVSNTERYKDRVETLTVVSTLIITASVAACLAVPGEADGAAKNLHHAMFQFFIICITISLFSSISATIILFWARLGLIELMTYSLKIVMPLLGVALISLSLAFLAGIYTVISKLSWLATIFVVMTLIFVVVVFLLYILLFLPSSSTSKPLRYISYYPFLFLASLAEPKTTQGTNF